MMMNKEELEALEDYVTEIVTKPIRTDYGFGGKINNYIKYTSRGDRYENLSPGRYLGMIRPCLRVLINGYKPTEELNNDGDTEFWEWEVQLVMQNNCISAKDFEELEPYIQQVNQ